MIQEIGSVREIRQIRSSIFHLLLELPAIAVAAKPGQFLHLLAPGKSGLLLRRPFSIAGIGGSTVSLLIRIIGPGTEAISHLRVGDSADVIGPLGSVFDQAATDRCLLVGGGIGAAPLIFLQDELGRARREAVLLVGSRTYAEFPLADEEASARGVIACTDDGSYGQAGFVSQALENYLKSHTASASRVYSCGPAPMMKEIARICAEYGLPHQVSLENRMGCGVGVCQGCALKLNQNNDRGGYRLVCKDGPVFDAAEIDWSLM